MSAGTFVGEIVDKEKRITPYEIAYYTRVENGEEEEMVVTVWPHHQSNPEEHRDKILAGGAVFSLKQKTIVERFGIRFLSSWSSHYCLFLAAKSLTYTYMPAYNKIPLQSAYYFASSSHLDHLIILHIFGLPYPPLPAPNVLERQV